MLLLETPRLKICYMGTEDAPFMLALLNTPAYYKYIGDRNVRNLADAENYILNGPVKSYEKNGFGYYVVKLKDDERPVGICGLVKRDALEDVDIGFAFLPEYEGKGFGFESSSSLMHWANQTLGIKKLVGITLENNLPSIRLLEKMGLTFNKKIVMEDEELLLYARTFQD